MHLQGIDVLKIMSANDIGRIPIVPDDRIPRSGVLIGSVCLEREEVCFQKP